MSIKNAYLQSEHPVEIYLDQKCIYLIYRRGRMGAQVCDQRKERSSSSIFHSLSISRATNRTCTKDREFIFLGPRPPQKRPNKRKGCWLVVRERERERERAADI
jgi:hypothetical protein